MNTMAIAPEVREFLAAVRAELADLDPDEQREILDGLEADLSDLVAERGGEALGDPVAYSRELRQAAGLEPATSMKRSVSRRSVGDAVNEIMDVSRHALGTVLSKVPGDAAAVLTWLRPVWWVLRGWAAVQVVDRLGGGSRVGIVPDVGIVGWFWCLLAIAGSIALGRGAFWPGGARRGALGRVVLLGLNVLALVVTPVAISRVVDSLDHRYDRGASVGFEHGYRAAMSQTTDGPKAGLYLDGTWVSNIYPYDAQGRPLVGVQLFNQIGKPINVITQPEYPVTDVDDNGDEVDADGNPIDPNVPLQPRVFYPWTNGATQLLNVFPIPSRVQADEQPSTTAFTEANRPKVGRFPLASVPAVSLPGIKPGARSQDR